MWQVYVFNLVAALLIAGWYLRSVRRLERRIDARIRRYDEWAAAEDAKYARASEEIRASLRAQMDRAIAGLEAKHVTPTQTATEPPRARAVDSRPAAPAEAP